VEFQIEASAENSGPVMVEAQLGDDVVTDTIAIVPDPSKPIRVPGNQYVRYGSELRFHVSPSDPSATLSTLPLPPGAYFDAAAADFHWIPDATQIGAHEIQFTTGDSSGITAIATVKVQVENGEPVVTGIVNAASRSSNPACSPGAIAAVQGRWFTAAPPASDASGASFQLAGAKVLVNGIAAPILNASAGELSFLCPQGMPGSNLQIEVQTEQGISAPTRTIFQAVAPGIFSIEGLGGSQGAALLEGTSAFAVVRNHRLAGRPALPGEWVVVYATGIDNMTNVVASFGGLAVRPDSIIPVPNRPGLFQITIHTPDGLGDGEIPLSLTGEAPAGVTVSSNVVSIAMEGNSVSN
jgi:uncharacterized protein (TIGR03437 family)